MTIGRPRPARRRGRILLAQFEFGGLAGKSGSLRVREGQLLLELGSDDRLTYFLDSEGRLFRRHDPENGTSLPSLKFVKVLIRPGKRKDGRT